MFFIQEPSLDASYRGSGPEGHHDSQTSSGAADSLHSNGNSSPSPLTPTCSGEAVGPGLPSVRAHACQLPPS